MARKAKPQTGKRVEALRHARADATRKNIPTAEYQSVIEKDAQDPHEARQESFPTSSPISTASPAASKSGRIAVKVINHLGDEVMKVFRVV